MTSTQTSCRLLHHGAAATSSSKAVICIPSESSSQSSEIVYASHAILNVAHCCNLRVARNGDKKEPIWNVNQTLRTDTEGSASANNTVATATAKRVITCICQLKRRQRQTAGEKADPLIIACGFSDGTITSWCRRYNHWSERVLLSATEERCDGRSVTDIAGLCDDKGNLVIVSCTSGGAHYYEFRNDQSSDDMNHVLVHTPSNAVRFHTLESNAVLILIGTAAPRHNKIHVFKEESSQIPHYCGPLTGHEDWITCFDWFAATSADFLASGSQDAKIRLWKFNTTTITSVVEADMPALKEEETDNDDDDGNSEEEIEEGEARLEVFHEQKLTSVTLEALLIGHEERVTSVSWHPNPKPIYGQELILISSSMDRTIFIWSEHESGVWTPISRVGSAGGILGGSIGSTLLGFLGTQLEPNHGRWLLGHGYGGALHFFSCDKIKEADQTSSSADLTVEQRAALYPWTAQPCITGHFDGVTDLCWEAESGDYLITVSNDQTCRLWTPLAVSGGDLAKETWVEIARPQVHGYNLSAVTSLSTAESRHLLVTGADEKEIRVFDGTLAFMRLLGNVAGDETSAEHRENLERVERAYIPSLGLTNKATAADGAEEDTTGVSESRTQLPLERDLGAVSLWPETLKLYGHQTELARLASTVAARSGVGSFDSYDFAKDVLVASSAKAREVDAANIRIWDVKQNRCVQVLAGGHRSTVTALSFSPDGKYLASSGKDRRLCLWQRSEGDKSPTDQEKTYFFLAAALDSAHKRIIWGVHFCPFEPNILASGSRDGTVKVWKLMDANLEGKKETSMEELFCFNPVCKGTNNKGEAVTSLAFAPSGINNACILAVGLENGLIELWQIPLVGTVDTDIGPEVLLCFAPEMCHIATVTKLAWRPRRSEANSSSSVVLASCSTDHGCRIFDINIPRDS